jgi:glycosyltransferase involved in cell wall biosynthesis
MRFLRKLNLPKLAIISTYNENCGNASYTHVLKTAFSKYVDVDVIPIDLFLLQGKGDSLIRAGDRHIKDICRKLAEYDFVNIQFEGGLYGPRLNDIYRRIKWLIDAAPNVTLTMHRVDSEFASLRQAVTTGIGLRSYRRFKTARGANKFSYLSKNVVQYCEKAAKKKNVWIKVHTRREGRAVNEIYGNKWVYDYPLAFLTPEERGEAWAHNDRAEFLRKHGFALGDKVVGLFGYLSSYKGIETAIEAISILPPEYKLGVFGSQHPQTVKRGELVNPYLQSIFDLMEEVDDLSYENTKKEARIDWLKGNREKSTSNDSLVKLDKIRDRIRFIGSLPDPEFIEALRLCDAVVLPYLEVGQSMSGVAILGMEAGAKMIAANNNSFAQVRRYYPDTFIGFDMGNAFELAQKIESCSKAPELYERRQERFDAFNSFNIDNSVKLQLEKFGYKMVDN